MNDQTRYNLFILIPTLLYCVWFVWLFAYEPPPPDPNDYVLSYTFGLADGKMGTIVVKGGVFDSIDECTNIARPLNLDQPHVLVQNMRLRIVYVGCIATPALDPGERAGIHNALMLRVGPITRVP